MELYYGSTLEVARPEIRNRLKTLDFGTGFYTTSNESQAQEFSVKTYLRRGRTGTPTVSVYEFDFESAQRELRIMSFPQPDEAWLAFVTHNRRQGRDPSLDLDMVIGPVANDDVFQTIALYEAGQIDEETAIRRFKVKRLFDQYLFCNERALGYLRFNRSYVVERSR